ncbi:hypothetical protein RIO-1_32 [Pseudoalteromonas phage RIO-1]|uniref:Uncharacterized protein n=1 Tax=Pseudoalteromonas phage RIO-1 TaxID=1316739 RepID=R4JGV0_9CAUD|nr:hypothetical protein RIO-1_32 [Pseudoalteromonas phage RIO-1]AGK87046.1 hypothetical protein RIO-1_32 [Pseudoalteromonas phage RIO-1]
MERLYELRDIVKDAPDGATHYDRMCYYRYSGGCLLWHDWERGWVAGAGHWPIRSLEDIKYIIHLLESIQFELGG